MFNIGAVVQEGGNGSDGGGDDSRPASLRSDERKDLGAGWVSDVEPPSAGPEERSVWQWMADTIFGYDFFISYTWSDGRNYSQALARELKSLGFECFLDSERYKSGDDWKRVGFWTLRKTRCLVLVGSPDSLKSAAVLHELKVFSEFNNRIIPIDFDGTLSPGPGGPALVSKYLPPEVLRVRETTARLAFGPSEHVVRRLRDDFDGVRQDRWRLRVLLAATAVFAMIAVVALWQSVAENRQRRTAEWERDRANVENRIQTGRRLATSAQFERERRPERSLLLAVEAIMATRQDQIRLSEAEQALRDAVGCLGGIPLSGQAGTIWDIGFTHDNRWLATASGDGTARLWDLSRGSSSDAGQTLRGHTGPVRCLALTADGRHLITASEDKTVRLWGLDDRGIAGPPIVLYEHGGKVYCAAVSPDGRWLATGGDDRAVRTWDLRSGGSPGAGVLGCGVPGTPYLTGGANSGKSGRARREEALRLMAIRQARLEPLALSASGHREWSTVGQRRVGRNGLILSAGIACFGAILK